MSIICVKHTPKLGLGFSIWPVRSRREYEAPERNQENMKLNHVMWRVMRLEYTEMQIIMRDPNMPKVWNALNTPMWVDVKLEKCATASSPK